MIKQFKFSHLINRQQGFTLIEMLIAVVIVSLIGTAAATLSYQTVRINTTSTSHQLAISQIENSVHHISIDAQQAQNVIPKDASDTALVADPATHEIDFDLISGDKLFLRWIAWDNTKNEITYTINGDKLQRTLYVNDVLDSNTDIAHSITGVEGTWNTSEKALNIEIQVTVGSGTSQTVETRTFQINPRPAQ